MARDEERDVRDQIRVALFWRALIGDYEYIKFDPNDLLRWYDALDLRGPEEIRLVINERYTSRPVSIVQGIVSGAPHPPTWLVREWLSFHEQKVRTGGYWLGAGAFLTMSAIFAPLMYGCAHLTPDDTYVLHPPASGPPQYTATAAPPGSNYMPNNNQPPATFTPTQTGAQSSGIAGAATGVTSPTGATGPSNVGASAGLSSGAGSTGSSQP